MVEPIVPAERPDVAPGQRPAVDGKLFTVENAGPAAAVDAQPVAEKCGKRRGPPAAGLVGTELGKLLLRLGLLVLQRIAGVGLDPILVAQNLAV